MVFRWQWPEDIRSQIKTFENPKGTITNSDLEMAGLLLLWLAMEEVCGPLQEKQIALFSVVSLLDMYHTKVLMYRTMVLMARLTKVRR